MHASLSNDDDNKQRMLQELLGKIMYGVIASTAKGPCRLTANAEDADLASLEGALGHCRHAS